MGSSSALLPLPSGLWHLSLCNFPTDPIQPEALSNTNLSAFQSALPYALPSSTEEGAEGRLMLSPHKSVHWKISWRKKVLLEGKGHTWPCHLCDLFTHSKLMMFLVSAMQMWVDLPADNTWTQGLAVSWDSCTFFLSRNLSILGMTLPWHSHLSNKLPFPCPLHLSPAKAHAGKPTGS